MSAILVCRDDQHVIEWSNGDLGCMSCLKCPPGSGVTVPCGSTVPSNVSVTCKACVQGEYSNSFSSESCKPCSTCLPDEVLVAKCTNISDTRCSCKPCPKGYYRNKTISKCLPCSQCCLDGTDKVVPQCVSQKIPRTQTCRYQKKKPCGSKCGYDEITVLKRDRKKTCQLCPVCSKEHGLNVPCGSVVHEEMLIRCESPTLGKTFVNQQGILQSCSICSPGQEVVGNCSSTFDTKCGGCKHGFFYNYHSKSCQECFWCCGHSDSDTIIKCIREGMLSVERTKEFQIRQSRLSLRDQVHTQSPQTPQDYCFLRLVKAENMTLTLGFICVVFCYFSFNYIFQRRKDSANKIQNLDAPTLDKIDRVPVLQEAQSDTTQDAGQDSSVGEIHLASSLFGFTLLSLVSGLWLSVKCIKTRK